MIDGNELERITPWQVQIDDVLYLHSATGSHYALVTDIREHLASTRCQVVGNPNANGIHDHDAFHFTVELWSRDNVHRGNRVICEPVAMTAEGHGVLHNTTVNRVIQKKNSKRKRRAI